MNDAAPNPRESVDKCIVDRIKQHPLLEERIYRQLLIALHTRGIVSIDQINRESREKAGIAHQNVTNNPNAPAEQRMDDSHLRIANDLIRDYACEHLSVAEVNDLVNLVLKREEAQSLADVANLPSVSFRLLVERLRRFTSLPLGEARVDPSEMYGVRAALARHFISDDLEFIGVAKQHLRVRDYDELTKRIIGSDSSMGRIGGKAGGMILAHRIIHESGLNAGADLPITIPESYYLRSDVIDQFLDLNGLSHYHNQKYKDIEEIANEYPLIKGVFRNSAFPVEIVHQLRSLLETIDGDPLIVRSSSLLEDRMSSAFSGKYDSIFVPNQGPLELRLRALLGAIGEVYASTLGPDPILYRRKHNLIDYVEEMAILIQRVCGHRFGKYFMPIFAGVVFSRNEYRWSPRIKREDGFARMVMGLGTRAVDRVGGDYPRMVALGAPTLRPENSPNEIRAHSQRTIDVINLENNTFDSITLPELLKSASSIPMLDKLVSIHREGDLYSPASKFITDPPGSLCITFDKMLKETPLAERIQEMLRRLEAAFGRPVDVEFCCDGEKFYMLQCRGQHQAADIGHVDIPEGIPQDRIVFTAKKFVRTALVSRIEYVVYINSRVFNEIDSNERRLAIARVVGRINTALAGKRFILAGPGRWGTTDIRLGVRVSYADISNARMLIEIARERDGYVPEVSFGTHFFQDLVEDDIAYLPLYPDKPEYRFNEEFFNQSPNVIESVSPRDADFAGEVRVIHVPAFTGGKLLEIAMDGESDRALAYLK